jgi:protoporphyrinogen/coproporphyrinogen III oxidase
LCVVDLPKNGRCKIDTNVKNHPKIIVIGAGMAGLSAAYTLAKAGYDVHVMEERGYAGGRVYTESVAGLDIEGGAQFLAGFYKNTWKLLAELNLTKDLIPISGNAAILKFEKLIRLPYDWRVLLSPIISFKSKFQILKILPDVVWNWTSLDFHDFSKAHYVDNETISEYARKKLSFEMLEYVMFPVLSGIFYWIPERTSKAMLLILAKAAPGLRLFTLDHGIGQLPLTMASQLNISLNCQVTGVERNASGRYVVKSKANGIDEITVVDAIVCATTADRISKIFDKLDGLNREFFNSIEYSTTIGASIGFNNSITKGVYGIFFPRIENKIDKLSAATFQSGKNSMRLSENFESVGLFSTSIFGKAMIDSTDDEIVQHLLTEFSQIGPEFQVRNPEFTKVHRWPQALPLMDTGYFRRLNTFAQEQNVRDDLIVFAGDYIGGPFIEGAVTSGMSAANILISRMRS